MPKRESEPLIRLHVNLFESDYERLKELFGSNVGMATAVRKIVRSNLKRIDEKFAAKQRAIQIDAEDIDFD